MVCKKGEHVECHDGNKHCVCLKRRHVGCAECEKKAIKVVHDSGRDLNEIVMDTKNGGDFGLDLYVGVKGFDGDPHAFYLRSSVDILRGVCKYCQHENSDTCNECMWLNNIDLEDHWVFNECFSKTCELK